MVSRLAILAVYLVAVGAAPAWQPTSRGARLAPRHPVTATTTRERERRYSRPARRLTSPSMASLDRTPPMKMEQPEASPSFGSRTALASRFVSCRSGAVDRSATPVSSPMVSAVSPA